MWTIVFPIPKAFEQRAGLLSESLTKEVQAVHMQVGLVFFFFRVLFGFDFCRLVLVRVCIATAGTSPKTHVALGIQCFAIELYCILWLVPPTFLFLHLLCSV